MLPVQHCQPGGLAIGPNENLLIGCTETFDSAGHDWSAKDANSAAPASVIMDLQSGKVLTNVAGVTGNDEVWLNAGDQRYYVAARNNPGDPVLGVIDARQRTLVQLVPTLNTPAKVSTDTGWPGQPSCLMFPAGTAHSVAADPQNNHVFVAESVNNVQPNCLNGCIGVFGTPQGDNTGT